MAPRKPASSPWDFDLDKLMGGMKVPTMDTSLFLDAQRKNLQAMAAANQTAVEGMQTVVKRHADLMRQSLESINELSTGMMTPGSPKDQFAKQAEMTKKQFEKSLSDMKEMAELIGKSQAEVSGIITSRISEALDEVRTAAEKKG